MISEVDFGSLQDGGFKNDTSCRTSNTGNIETQGTGTYVIRKDENTSVEKNALEDFRRCSQQKQHAKTLIAMLLTTNRLE